MLNAFSLIRIGKENQLTFNRKVKLNKIKGSLHINEKINDDNLDFVINYLKFTCTYTYLLK